MIDLDQLNDQFSIEGELGFSEMEGDLISVSVYNKYADASISLYGGHVIHFRPHNTFDVLWMSPDSSFEVGKPIRGGIPICFPWFGPNAENADLPMHGFARLMYWDVIKTKSTENGETLIVLGLSSSDETKKYWPFEFEAELEILVGKSLSVALNVKNTGSKSLKYTSALHSYFNVSEINNIQISGLENAKYYQGFGDEVITQKEPFIEIKGEENRRYVNTSAATVLYDSAFNRKIRITKEGSEVTVVWNPWIETIKNMPDLPNDGYQTYVCVEAANAYDDVIELSEGETHCTKTQFGMV